jgi:Flp pilus assembly protein TadD
VDLDPRDADAWTQLGVAAAIRGDFRRARTCLERALSIEPGHPVARANLDRVNRLPPGRR